MHTRHTHGSEDALHTLTATAARRRIRTLWSVLLLIWLGAFAAIGAADICLDLPRALRLALGGTMVIFPIVGLVGAARGGRLSRRAASRYARELERRAPLPFNPLVNGVQAQLGVRPRGVLASELRARAVDHARTLANDQAVRQAARRTQGRPYSTAATMGLFAAGVAVALVCAQWPALLPRQAVRLFLPLRDSPAWAPIAIHLTLDNDAPPALGDPLDVSVVVEPASGGVPTLTEDQGTVAVPLRQSETGRYAANIGPLHGRIELTATRRWLGRTICSIPLVIDPKDRVRIVSAYAVVRAPGYAGGDENIIPLVPPRDAGAPPARCMAGGTVEVVAAASGDLGHIPGCDVRRNVARKLVALDSPGTRTIGIPIANASNTCPGLIVEVERDRPPIAVLGDSLDRVNELRAPRGQNVALHAGFSDDAGLAWSGVAWSTEDHARYGIIEPRMAAPTTVRSAAYTLELNPRELGVSPGDAVSVWAVACDNRPDSLGGPQPGASRSVRICWEDAPGRTELAQEPAQGEDANTAGSMVGDPASEARAGTPPLANAPAQPGSKSTAETRIGALGGASQSPAAGLRAPTMADAARTSPRDGPADGQGDQIGAGEAPMDGRDARASPASETIAADQTSPALHPNAAKLDSVQSVVAGASHSAALHPDPIASLPQEYRELMARYLELRRRQDEARESEARNHP